jgi:terminal uridylyltransferase
MICRTSISEFEQQVLGNERFDASTVEVQCFGSMKSGFATRASDMDLALLSPKSSPAPDSPESRIPRLLEKKLLDLGYGARLLTRTRVPIIKLCQRPTEKLLSDLLEERAKWENGFAADAEGDEEDLNEAEIPIQKQRAAKRKRSQNQISPETSASVPVKSQTESYQEKLSLLKQKEHQPLGDYYNSAKRLLRKLGGRDLSASSPDLDEPESKVLNDICKAFVLGLSSDALSTRLRNYQSISPLFNASLPSVQRSLHGVWIQIEGERLALAWESRPIIEANDKHEFECLNAVEAWRALQDKNGPLTEPSLYNRQLFAASEKLKKISSLQLVFLEQLQHEEPTYYYARTQRIKEDLRSTGVSEDSDSVTPIIMAHYVSGVRDQQIQECLQAFNGKTLQNVALEHRKLQLAVDYEHALKLDLFDQGDVPDVERYISLLRTHSTEQLAVFQAQQTSGALELTRLAVKMRTLPDPTQISPLKPRDRYNDHLEFPKSGIGIQCDINFSAHLAIHNTLLLRCYSHSDSRVKQLILFVKHWAKVRGINTPYRGTLSSYGYVLMVLHYLVNVVQPFVCPNLQAIHRDQPSYLPPAEIEARTTCNGRDVRFWRNEAEIKDLAARKMLNHNHDSVGVLLRGFFEYYAQNGPMTTVQHRSFDWGREALSLRTHGGILSKQEKGWVGAKTVVETTTIAAPPTPTKEGATNVNAEASNTTVEGDTPDAKAKHHVKTMEETKEIRHRYLFAIEDPFEVDHNVARTVTHNGIVSIRDEFRRAWRIIRSAGKGHEKEGLLDPLPSGTDAKAGLQELLTMIHGQASKVEVQVAVQAA